MWTELVILGVFFGIQYTFHKVNSMGQHPFLEKLSHHHWLIWLAHPTVVHTIQDYTIHFVIYSGLVIRGH